MLQERSGGRADVSSQNSSSTKQTPHIEGAEERKKEPENDNDEEEGGYSLVAVSQGMKHFLSAMSSHEGAELPWWDGLSDFLASTDLILTTFIIKCTLGHGHM